MGKTGVDIQALNSYVLNKIIKKPSEPIEVMKSRRQKAQQQFISLVKYVHSTSDGQANVVSMNDCYTNFLIQIEPRDGPFIGGKFKFDFNLSDKYPMVAPNITCVSEILHPNIDDDGKVCLSLFDDWCPDVNDLLDCVQGLLFLLNNPNLDDPLNPNFAPGEYTMQEFFESTQKWIAIHSR